MKKELPIYAIILAGGKGTRLNAKTIPKVLYEVGGCPMIDYVYDATKKVTDNIIVVTGFCGDRVKKHVDGKGTKFVHQARRLGTAHATLQARKLLEGKRGITLIINGDHPLLDATTLRLLITTIKKGNKLALASAIEKNHAAFGRVLRDQHGKVIGVREAKDASKKELVIKEKNIGFYGADNEWLWGALQKIKKSPVSGEYYVTDLVRVASAMHDPVEAVPVKNINVIKGINTHEELEEVERIIKKG